jgi:signal transduction histidine kinase
LVRTAAVVFLVLAVGSVLVTWFTDDAMTRHETSELAEAFDALAPILTEHAPESMRVPASDFPPPEAIEGRTRVHVLEDHYAVTIDTNDGMVVSVARIEWEWLPGRSTEVLLVVGLLLAALASAVLTVPLLLRVRTLAGHVETFAEGHYDERAHLEGRDEVAELAGHFNAMADRVQGNFEAQHALVQAIAHEYRTPLASARIAAALVAESDDPDDRAKQAVRLEDALADLERLADEVRFYARAGEPTRTEPVDLADITRERVARARDLAELNWTLELPDSLPWEGDLPLLARVFDNLLSNAARHARSEVRVSLTRRTRVVELQVDDDGPGIPREMRRSVFEPFVRVDDARRRATGGHGLGLAIVGRMVRASGGTVSIEDAALGGASVQISLPVR